MTKLLGIRINLISMILKASLEHLDWKKEIIISFTKDVSSFTTYEIPAGIHEVSYIKNTFQNIDIEKSIKAKVSIDIITMKSRLNTSNVLRFDWKILFYIKLGASLHWDNERKVE